MNQFDRLFSVSGLSLDRLRGFLEVEEAGNIAKAAKADPTRQSQFSRQVKELEGFFGVALTRRVGRRIEITEEGHKQASVIRRHFPELDDFRESMAGRFGRQVLANGDVVYLETENVDNIEDGAMFSSPSGSLREQINSAFNLPPSNYEYKASNERQTSILEIAAANGIELVDSRNLSSATRDFQKATGAIPVFYRGGKPSTAEFVARSSPDAILINVECQDVPIRWTLAHELTHVAHKDPAVESLRSVRQIASLLTRAEMAQIEKYFTDAGYEESSFLSELPAFLIADAVTGQRISGFNEITKLERLNESLLKFFDEIKLPLKTEALRQANDEELASSTSDRTRERIAEGANAQSSGLDAIDEGQASFPLAVSPSVPPFYSQLQRTIEAKMPSSGTPAQVLQIATSGAKAEEVKWSGFIPWLEGREKVSKAEVLECVANEGSVRFQELTQSDQPEAIQWTKQGSTWTARTGNLRATIESMTNGKFRLETGSGTRDVFPTLEEAKSEVADIAKRIGTSAVSRPTRYAQYVLPGGENYREVVLAMPPKGAISTRINPEGGGSAALEQRTPDSPHRERPQSGPRRIASRCLDGSRRLTGLEP